jgi:hypothetical protein
VAQEDAKQAAEWHKMSHGRLRQSTVGQLDSRQGYVAAQRVQQHATAGRLVKFVENRVVRGAGRSSLCEPYL